MKDVERTCPELGRVGPAQVGRTVESSTPRDVRQDEPSVREILVEIAVSSVSHGAGDIAAEEGKLDAVDDLGSAMERERQRTASSREPSAEGA
jgi:hypothetical protein